MEKSVGQIISSARKLKNISQDKLANKLHVSRQTISNWENDLRVPDADDLEKLCKILDLDCNVIFSLVKNKYQSRRRKFFNKIVIILIVVIIVVFCMFLLLVNFRNKFIVYNIYLSDNEEVYLVNGIYINSNVNKYFQLGSIHFYDETNMDNYKIKIYNKINNGIRLLVETNYNDNIVLNERNGYEEYFNYNFDINNVYIDLISLSDNSLIKTYKLNFSKVFASDKLFYRGIRKGTNDNEVYINNKYVTHRQLLDSGYKFENNDYIKQVNNGTFQFDMNENILYFYNFTLNLKYNLKTDTISGNEYDYETQKLILDFYFNNKTNEFLCYTDSCDNYKEQIGILTNELNLLLE